MINILYAIPSLRMGGAERLVIDICREVNKRSDAKAMIVVFGEENKYATVTKDIPIKVCHSKVRLSFLRYQQTDLTDFENIVNQFQPDIIHSHLFEAEIITREKTFKNVRYFTHCHDNMPQLRNFSVATFFNKRFVTDFYEKKHLIANYIKCNNKFIAISENTKSYFEQVLPPILGKNITLLPNAINFNLFNKGAHQRVLDKVRIINVGSFVPKKNQQFIIAIAAQLKKRGLEPEITLLGNGPLYEEVKAQVTAQHLDEIFSMPGNVEHAEDYYSRANIYVHTATYEPFGLVLLEAMAAGLPVVSLDGKGNRGLIQNGVNGFFIEEQRPEMFADAIQKTVSDKSYYNELSTHAIDFARGYNITSYVDRLIELYRKR